MPVRMKTCTGPCKTPKLLTEYWVDAQQPDGRKARCKDCIKAAREERSVRSANGEVVPRYSEEEIERRSQRAKKLHADGRLGGSEFGRMGPIKRKARINDAVLEHFRQPGKTEMVIRAIESNLRSRNHSAKLKGAKLVTDLENSHEETLAKLRGAGKGPDDMSPEELEEFLVQGMTAMIERGELPIDLPAEAAREEQSA